MLNYMVRKSKTVAEEETPVVDAVKTLETEDSQAYKEPVALPVDLANAESEADVKVDAEEEAPVEENKSTVLDIPDKAKAYLKRHTEVKEVYIDKLGGVYPSDTPTVFVKNATLYQNPYFKL
jgi:hypothetical protein